MESILLLLLAVKESSLISLVDLATFICIDLNDIMYVTDRSKCQVMMFTTEGKFLGSFVHNLGGHLFYPCRLAADKSGNVYVCDGSTQEVLVSRPFY